MPPKGSKQDETNRKNMLLNNQQIQFKVKDEFSNPYINQKLASTNKGYNEMRK